MAINPNDRVWEIMEQFTTALLITNGGLETRGRPMAVTVRREDNALYFLSDVTSDKDYEIQFDPAVVVAFIDPSSQKYVWLRGRAIVANDRAKIRELWSPFAKAWWDNADDPDIRVIAVTPESAEYWDTAGKLASYAAMLTAVVTGAKPKVGEERSVAF
jgi:general stress protein 26